MSWLVSCWGLNEMRETLGASSYREKRKSTKSTAGAHPQWSELLLLSCVEPALGARWKGDWSPLVIVNWDLPQADGAQGQYGRCHKMWAFLFHHKGRSGGKCGWGLYRSHILRSCLEGHCHESELCSVSICGRGWGMSGVTQELFLFWSLLWKST